jgi:hypothetical protein
MKKFLTAAFLILAVTTSIVAGSLALYTTRIDDLAEGSVVAKEFVLVEGGTDTFATNVKVAPGETNTWQFSVRNYEGALVSETAMNLAFAVDVQATEGKAAIAPLTVTVTNEAGDVLGEAVTGTGTISFGDFFALTELGQENVYTVTVTWPSGEGDTAYAGAGYGTTVFVSVTGTQA